MYGSPDQSYYCQMGPPPPMAQPATMSPNGQGMYQPPPHYDLHQQQSGDMSSPGSNHHLTVLPPQSPHSMYGSPNGNNSMPGTPMSHTTQFSPSQQFSPSSDSVSPPNNICYQQQRSPQMPDSTNYNDCGPSKQPQNGMKKGAYRGKAGQPYIPSYMDLTNGPEPCVVCSDAATGYHYRCMTCEGCKGFFRRTIQKNLQYHCKWSSTCIIDKTTRNQCQYCRFQKCVAVGMATDLVLNEKQRVAKRKLIQGNRDRRREDAMHQAKIKAELPEQQSVPEEDSMSKEDRQTISQISSAYEQTSVKVTKTYTIPERAAVGDNVKDTDPDVWQQLAEVMTPSIVKVVEFAKRVPGFMQLNVEDQILLLKSCCMEIMCLRAACRYNSEDNTLTLQNGLILTKSQLGTGGGLGMLMEPIFDFAIGLAKLRLDDTEIALLAAVLLMQSDRTGLREPEPVEEIQDDILGAYKRYIAENRPHQPVHWAKVLMKVTDLRTISTRHAERVLCIKLDSPGELPPLFLEMFDEGCKPAPINKDSQFPPGVFPQGPEAPKLVPMRVTMSESIRESAKFVSVFSRPSSVASNESSTSSFSSDAPTPPEISQIHL